MEISQIQRPRSVRPIYRYPNKLSQLVISFCNLGINVPVMISVWRERRSLELLTVEHMQDVGLDPADVKLECKKSFIDIPKERQKMIVAMKQSGWEREF